MSRCQLIEQRRANYAVDLLCQTLGVAPSYCYAWRKRRPQPAAGPVTADWQEAMKEAFTRHKRGYGTRWLRAELHA